MINKLNLKRIIIFSLTICIVSISIVYSVLNMNMKINSIIAIKGIKDLKIMNIESINENCGYNEYNPKFTDNTIIINGNLPNLECTLEYEITLINNTNITMQLIDIYDDIYNNFDIIYNLDELNIGDIILPNETIKFYITFKYNSNLINPPDNTNLGTVLEFIWYQYTPIVPSIVLDSDLIEIEYGNYFDIMSGIKAFDLKDGDITDKITYDSNLDINITGKYEIIYTVTNSFGETSNATRTIMVIDNKPPEIIINDRSNIELFINDSLNLKSLVIAYDEYDGNINDNLIVTSNPTFNNKKSGVYKIFYNVIDSNNNSAEAKELTITVFEFIKIKSGSYHTLALTSHGKVYAWGQGTYGQLGQGNTSRIIVPTLIPTLNNIIDIAAGEGSSFAVSSDGIVYSWGYNATYRLGHEDLVNRNTPTKIAALSSEKIVEISTTYATVAALTENGRVYTWGYGGYGALGNGIGTNQGKPILIEIDNVKSVKMGWYHGGALKDNGDLYLWGTNLEGQMALGTTSSYNYKPTLIQGISNVVAFSCGGRHTLALTNNGDLYSWGYNDQGQIGDNTITTKSNVTKILSNTNIMDISAGYNSSSLVDELGQVYTWGYNIYGKLGLNDTTRRLTPTINPYIINGKYVESGYNTSFIITVESKIYGMGYNVEGSIGDGTTQEKRIPTLWKFNY